MKNKILIFVFLVTAIMSLSFFEGIEKKSIVNKISLHIDEVICVKCHYYDSVNAKENGVLYKIVDNQFVEVGSYNKGFIFYLDGIVEEYFNIKGTDYYIHYSNTLENKSYMSNRYSNYINIGKKIALNDFTLYKSDDSYIKINDKLSFEVIYIDGNKYYVSFNNNMYYVLENDILEVLDVKKSSDAIASNIAVLNYHFIYDKDYESCNERICIEKDLFESHLMYLKENGFFTITMNEFNLWMDQKLLLPKKSVLITFDDGALGTDTHLIELLEKYDMNASLFLITAWWSKDKYESPNLEIYSHGYDIHLDNWCSNGPRGLCLSKKDLVDDFSWSIPLVDNNLAFCYPFYRYNNLMIEALKELNFSLAFVGGNRKAKPSDNKYLVPRYPIYNNTSVDNLKKIVN